MDIILFLDIQVSMLPHVLDIWPNYILLFSEQIGSILQLKSRTLDTSSITELSIDLVSRPIKESLEQHTVLKTHIL